MKRVCSLIMICLYFSLTAANGQNGYSLDSSHLYLPEYPLFPDLKTFVTQKNDKGLKLEEQQLNRGNMGGYYLDDIELSTYHENGTLASSTIKTYCWLFDTCITSTINHYNQYDENTYSYRANYNFVSQNPDSVALARLQVDSTISFEDDRPATIYSYQLRQNIQQLTRKTDYYRDANGRIDSVHQSSYNEDKFTLMERNIYLYNEQGKLASIENYPPNSIIKSSNTLFTYDEQQRPITTKIEGYESGDTLTSQFSHWTYSDLFSDREWLIYDLFNDTILFGFKFETFFLAEGVRDSLILSEWNTGTKSWNPLYHSKFFYSLLNPTKSYDLQSSYTIFPNPANSNLQIRNKDPQSKPTTIKIFAPNGKILFTARYAVESFEIDVSNFSNGFYFVSINNQIPQKIIIQH